MKSCVIVGLILLSWGLLFISCSRNTGDWLADDGSIDVSVLQMEALPIEGGARYRFRLELEKKGDKPVRLERIDIQMKRGERVIANLSYPFAEDRRSMLLRENCQWVSNYFNIWQYSYAKIYGNRAIIQIQMLGPHDSRRIVSREVVLPNLDKLARIYPSNKKRKSRVSYEL